MFPKFDLVSSSPSSCFTATIIFACFIAISASQNPEGLSSPDGAHHRHLHSARLQSSGSNQPEVVIVDASSSGDERHHSGGDPKYHFYSTSNNHDSEDHQPPTRYQVATFDFDHVSTPYIISLWIIIVGLAKIGFHVTPKLSSICPESVVLMVLGVIIGLIMYFAGIPEERLQPLTPNLFFLYMLPPIVMDAGYHMPNRLFFDNLTTILLYAVVGTIWNALAIGLSLYGCSRLGAFGEEIPFLDIMLFSSTVSAVDPVAVLAVFEEIHVNEVLYILVFGESLLNDAVTVVLYHMFEGYAEMAYHNGLASIQTIDYIAGVASFFVVALGGTAMGVAWGFLAAFVSRFTHHVKIIEPIFVFVMAYLSYLSAEMFHLSGILSLTFCGITMKNYVEENITQKSHTTLKYAMKMLANSSEAIIFVFLGVCTVNDQHRWNTPFVTLTIVFCLVYRTIGVVGLTALTNRFRLNRVNRVEQFIMAYGGLRGAVAFALILIINRQIIHAREMMVTTIIAVVYFTVFLQGMTVGALVNILNVPRANKFEMSMNERIHTRLMDHVMAGLEDISGMMMGNYKMRDKFRYYNNRYLRKWLLRDSKEMGNSSRKIFETCSRLDLQDAMNLVSRHHIASNIANQPTKAALAAYQNATFDPSGSDDDDRRNNNTGACFTYGDRECKVISKTPPTIFLTVPGAQQSSASPLVVDPNQSLTTLFRSYTQSNLSALAGDKSYDPNSPTGQPFEQGSTNLEFNYDLGNISYSPSLKDLKDAELHHILNDAMFKPFKKIAHYNRHDLSEPPPVHPPFQHQVRLQIRRLISQSEKNRKCSSQERSPKIKHRKRIDGDNDIEVVFKPDRRNGSPAYTVGTPEDDGIIFTAKSDANQAGGHVFPWKRNDNDGGGGGQEREGPSPVTSTSSSEGPGRPAGQSSSKLKEGVVRQREFPSWIENREYGYDYISPTSTLLERITLPEPQADTPSSTAPSPKMSDSGSQIPSVYEIFQLDKNGQQNNLRDTVIEFRRPPSGKPAEDTEDDENSIMISKL